MKLMNHASEARAFEIGNGRWSGRIRPRPRRVRSRPIAMLAAGLSLFLMVAEAQASVRPMPVFENRLLSFDVGAGPRSVAVGDLNGDGRPDLVAANAEAHTVSVLLALAHGGFEPRRDFDTGELPLWAA